MSDLVEDCITIVICRVSAPRIMRFRASGVLAIALLGVYLVTIAMVGCNISWLVGIDSRGNRVERRILKAKCRCNCGVQGSRKCPPDVSARDINSATRRLTTDEISHLIDVIVKEGIKRDRILEEADRKLLNKRNCSEIKGSSDDYFGLAGTEPSSVVQKNRSLLLTEVMSTFEGEWRKNEALFQEMKRDLTSCCEAESSFMTKQNVRVGEIIPNVLNPKLPLKMTKDLYRNLIKDWPFKNRRFNTCAVVGNSGILRGSYCGASIDSADAVFRCNLPPLGKKVYQEDAGTKSSFTTAPLSMLKSYIQMKDDSVREQFLEDMEQYDGILLAKKPNNYTKYMIDSIIATRGGELKMVYEHPHHFLRTNNYWNNHGIPKKITSGIYLLSLALTRCEEVHVYGFWPFPYDDKGNAVAYHYYEAPVFTKDSHDMPLEFMRVRRLHQDGVIQVHMRCPRDLSHRSRDLSQHSRDHGQYSRDRGQKSRDQDQPIDDRIRDLEQQKKRSR
ncbi:ST8SIA3 [Branchiostoma lanceolatum]|uniref:ST8SIA3 protein n=1 Tax=Branchiostoma lanceolatum TaxID=7740 RepID=A0A8K0ESE4_BRALA|nr:ST8SIA3 [Branchiostoma lanceolatum]